MRKPFERYSASGEINTQVDDAAAVIERDQRGVSPAQQQDRLDGLTVDCGTWWFNLRPSNTEPLLRLNLEAADRDACDDRVAELLVAHHRLNAFDRSRGTHHMALDDRSCSRSSPAPRTRARCTTSRPRRCSTTRVCSRRYDVRDDIPVMLIDEATTVDDAEHDAADGRSSSARRSRRRSTATDRWHAPTLT